MLPENIRDLKLTIPDIFSQILSSNSHFSRQNVVVVLVSNGLTFTPDNLNAALIKKNHKIVHLLLNLYD